MKHLIRNTLVAVVSIALAGCEWGGGGDDNSWNDSNNIANFNGSYQGNGGYLVSEYTTTVLNEGSSSTASNTSASAYVNRSESQTKHVQLNAVFSGQAGYTPIVPGSFAIQGGGAMNGLSVHDDGNGGLTGSSFEFGGESVAVSGYIVYATGAYGVTLSGGGVLDATTTLQLIYSQETSSGSSSSSSVASGASGVSIYTFQVQQSGNKLKIIDNNGSVYNGELSTTRTTGNMDASTQGAEFVNGDQVIANFYASGTSKANVHVNMTGNFQGTVEGVTTVTEKQSDGTIKRKTSMALSDRRILGTWVEDGGKTGNIDGVSPSSVNVMLWNTTSTNSTSST